MKKFNLAFVAVLSVLLTGLLCACTFKKVEANFSSQEIVVEQNDSIDLDELLSVSGTKKSEISYISSDSSLISIENRSLKSFSTYGRGYVYAKNGSNTLATLKVVVKKAFDAPTQFTYSAEGILSWNSVVGSFENKQTAATKYVVCGTLQPSEGESQEFSVTVENETQIELSQVGVYTLTVQTLGEGYFADSELSQTQKLYFGFEDAPTSLHWSNGLFSWDAVAGAKYQVKLGSTIFSEQTVNSLDLSSYFDSLAAGKYNLSVLVIDSEGVKLTRESEILTITKLETPEAIYDFVSGGNVSIPTAPNVKFYEILVDGEKVTTIENTSSTILTNLSGIKELADGQVHNLEIVAHNESGLFYHSKAQNFGRVIKLQPLTLTGNGAEVDATSLGITASGSSLVDTRISMCEYGEFDGLSSSKSSVSLAVPFTNAGIYSLVARQLPKNVINDVGGSVLVLGSDESENISVTVLAKPGKITHSYQNDKSVFTFAEVENATKYALQFANGTEEFVDVDAEKYSCEISEVVTITLNGRIENLFDASNRQYRFRIVAKTANDNLTINASTEKTLGALNSVTSKTRQNGDDTFAWNAVDGAKAYHVKVYAMTRQQYNSAEVNVEELELLSEQKETTATQVELPKISYYYITVQAIPVDEDLFVSSKNALAQRMIYSVQLELGNVEFGLNKEWENHETAQSSGYFLRIGGTENVATYSINLDSSELKLPNADDNTNVFLLKEDFAQEQTYTITVKGYGSDDVLYLPTKTATFTVTRLAKITMDDLTLDNYKNANVTVAKRVGASRIEVLRNSAQFKSFSAEQTWEFEIEEFASSTLTFSLFGSQYDDSDKTFTMNNGAIYLSSAFSTISFERLETPTSLRYESGKLLFENKSASDTDHYVIDLECLTANDVTYSLSLRIVKTGMASAVNVGGNSYVVILPISSMLVTTLDEQVSIDIGTLVTMLESLGTTNLELNTVFGIYNQSTSIKFDVYAVPNANDDVLMVSSNYATSQTMGEGGKPEVGVTVQKTPPATLSAAYDNTTKELTITWEELEQGSVVTIESDNPDFKKATISGSQSYTIGQADDYAGFSFWATVSRTDYLTSATSNKVTINKLAGITSVTLTDLGQLEFVVSQNDAEHYEEIKVQNGAKTVEPNGSYIDLTTSGAGTYTFNVVGKTEVVAETKDITFHIDAISTFVVEDLSQSDLVPTNQDVTLLDNVISWNAFSGDLTTLKYVVVFNDGKTVVKYETTQTYLDWKNDTQLETELSSLRGEVTINVFAKVDSYSVLAGGTIYYSDEVAYAEGDTTFNCHKYTGSVTAVKLTTPVVTGVEFKNTADDGNLGGELTPEIRVTFKGNYGKEAEFNIYWGDSIISGFEGIKISANEQQADAEGMFTYTLVLGSSVYANAMNGGDVMVLKIYALNIGENAGTIPSAAGSVTITKSKAIQSLELEQVQDKVGLSHKLIITFASQAHEPGDVILGLSVNGEVTYVTVKNSNLEKGTLEFDLDEVQVDGENYVSKFLANGGTLTITAFVKSFGTGTYYLASNLSSAYEVEFLQRVETQNITTTSYGFSISGINRNTTIYYATYTNSEGNNTEYVVRGGVFNTPDDWGKGSYTISIYAAENGFAHSAKSTVTVNITRIDAVELVTFSHGDDSILDGTLSWKGVTGADSYILKASMVKATEGTGGNTIYEIVGDTYETEVRTTKATLEEIFGEDYGWLAPYLESLAEDVQLRIDLVTVPQGSTLNISQPHTFYVTLKGNKISNGDIQVNQNGVISFNAMEDDVTYLYRFVDGFGVILQNWNKMAISLFDTSVIAAETEFAVQVRVMGSEKSTSNEHMTLDSVTYSIGGFYKLADVITFRHLEEEDKIVVNGTDEAEPVVVDTDDDILFELSFDLLNSTRIDKLLFGLSEKALIGGDYVAVNFLELKQIKYDTIYTYSYKLTTLIEKFINAGLWNENIMGVCDIYVWACKEPADGYEFVNSNFAKFTFTVAEEIDAEIFRLGKYHEVSESGSVATDELKDNTNTYVFVEHTADTIGLYVKVSYNVQIEQDDDSFVEQARSIAKFLTVKDLRANNAILRAYLQKEFSSYNAKDGYVIDILALLDADLRLTDLSGNITISFARAESKAGSYSISKWHDLEFVRIEASELVSVSMGNVTWLAAGKETTQYNVYLYSSIGENSYSVHETTSTHIDASKLVGNGKYYLSVQALNVDEDESGALTDRSLSILSSRQVFYLDDENGLPLQIYRNQVNAPLKLENGRMFFDWDLGRDSDFFDLLSSTNMPSLVAEQLATGVFTSPFTFTLSDIVDRRLYFNMRFTPITENGYGNSTTILNVRAADLLADLIVAYKPKGDLITRLETLAESNSTYRTIINQFATYVEEASLGIGNKSIFFDDYFEGLRTGKYKLEYSLVGATRTLTSQWYTYKNANGGEEFYVNPQPVVRAGKQEINKLLTTYTITINKSKLYDQNGNLSTVANNYVMRLGNIRFEIDSKGVVLYGEDATSSKMVNVEETDSTLTFHINLGQVQTNGSTKSLKNDSSILERFGDLFDDTSDLDLEIYAVGNNFSSSSKSEKFSVTFLKFGAFSLNEGKFVWDTQNGRRTTVEVSNLDNGGSQIEQINGNLMQSEYALDGYDAGRYAVKFVIKGEIETSINRIVVDSDVLVSALTYRLAAPTLSNTNGYLAISQNNTSSLQNAYTDPNVDLYRYIVYNDYSTENLSYTFSDGRISHETAYMYEVGTTGMNEGDFGFDYKYTEELASKFFVKMLGSSAELTFKDSANFYEKILVAEKDEESGKAGFAVQSECGMLSASMIDMVDGIRVEGGLLTWGAVTSRTIYDNLAHQSVVYELPKQSSSNNPIKVVYKLTITAYAKTGDGWVDEFTTQTFHTISTEFDMSKMTFDTVYENDEIYYKVLVQAFAMEISTTARGLALEDYENGERLYAFGNVRFEKQADKDEELFVLMSNGRQIDDVQRYNAIDEGSLKVSQGALAWTYTTGTHIQSGNFRQYYDFIVRDDNGKVVSGKFDLSEADANNTFTITFHENKGQISTDNTLLTVYVTQGTGTGEVKLNSYGTSIEAQKLGTITSADYDIETEIDSETLILKFTDTDSWVVATVIGTDKTYIFTAEENKLLIFSSEEEVVERYPVGYVKDYLVIGNEERVELTFRIVTDKDNVLFGDESDVFLFYRSSWEENKIEWNRTQQKFTWNYDYRSFTGATTGFVVEEGEVTEDAFEFSGSEVFTIAKENGNNTIIVYDDGTGEKQYQVSSSSIAKPTYIIDVAYQPVAGGTVVERTYITTDTEFLPTIIGKVAISIHVKINELNLQSEALAYSEMMNDQEITQAEFDLFARGSGTSEDEYIINNAQQFANINQRLSKPDMLKSFINSSKQQEKETAFFHFKLAQNLTIEDIKGFMIVGEFNGVLRGNGHSITYTSTINAAFSNAATLTVSESNVYAQTGDVKIDYKRGTALFEKFGKDAVVSGIEIYANFGADEEEGTITTNNTLLAGLVIENYGQISNVTVKGLTSTFVGDQAGQGLTVMAYSGIVALNRGSITESVVDAKIEISDYRTAQCIFFGGIAYTNYATIDSCSTTENGNLNLRALAPTDSLQLAGIVISNVSGSVTKCTNNANLYVTGSSGGRLFLAGIMALNYSSQLDGTNKNTGSLASEGMSNVTKGDIFAVNI